MSEVASWYVDAMSNDPASRKRRAEFLEKTLAPIMRKKGLFPVVCKGKLASVDLSWRKDSASKPEDTLRSLCAGYAKKDYQSPWATDICTGHPYDANDKQRDTGLVAINLG